jgi:hypothetical protein
MCFQKRNIIEYLVLTLNPSDWTWKVYHKKLCWSFFQAFHVPLSMKYGCPSPGTWKLAVTSLLNILLTGLPLARKHPQHFQQMWSQLADTLDHFLFPTRYVKKYMSLLLQHTQEMYMFFSLGAEQVKYSGLHP